ncbi:hypothetical protein BDY19DRAFT_969508 [Irpex rosettiformis]|uniref:Uncharacterized protein n=1 Tax=Irpex rosettiformis TaxID=378272 RepID=A0ACB8TS31_9APHY|nr:hypothetical protein BDY19DRAFT_969508 [Irpex rosettiformis]
MESPQPMDCDNNEDFMNRILNNDTLELIFDALLSPPGFLNISTQRMLERPWILQLRTLKRLVLVCKRWHSLGLRYLYAEICLRYVGQIPALARTIRAAPDTFSPLVHSLRIICYVPDQYMGVCAEDLQYLFDTCSNLNEVAFEERIAIENTFLTLGNITDSKFPHFSPDLQKLSLFCNWTDRAQAETIRAPAISLELLNVLPNLVSLSIQGFTLAEYPITPLTLPYLCNLCIHTTSKFILPDTWNLPSLVNLSVRNRMDGPGPLMRAKGITACENTKEFFDAHGNKLTHVDLGFCRMDWNTINIIVERCPQLYYLLFTIPMDKPLEFEPIRKIPYVDVLKQSSAKRVVTKWALSMLKKVEKNIRLLDRALLSFVPELPTVLPPEESSRIGPEDIRAFEHYGFTIMESNNAVWMGTMIPDDNFSDMFRGWNDVGDAKTDSDAESVRSENMDEESNLDPALTYPDDFDSDAESDTSYMSNDVNVDDKGEDYAMEDENTEEEDLHEEVVDILEDQRRHLAMPPHPHRAFKPDFRMIQFDREEVLARFADTILDDS